MIRYDLQCPKGHGFDGWFKDSAAFDSQKAKGVLSCPVCGADGIEKQMMAPGIPVKANRRASQSLAAATDPRLQEMLEALRQMRRRVEAEALYVGDRFAEEARRMHYNETELRGIYGEASFEEAKALMEEGIAVAPLPRLPEDGN